MLLQAQSIEQISQAATPGVLTVTATESTTGGGYSPKHITAVWIQDEAGKFVKTLLAYTGKYRIHLNNWESATTAFGSAYNTVDAVSSATIYAFGVRTYKWDGTNIANPRAVMPDGTYTVKLELTDKNNTGNLATFTFTKGAAAQTLTPTNQPSFSNVSLKWTPSTTGIDDVKLEKSYTVFPNPTKSNFNVYGPDIIAVELYAISGKKLKSTAESKMDISSLQKGIYFVVVRTKQGRFSKRIVKQ
jgi:hypothetical protein